MVTIGAGGGSIARVDGRGADRRPAERRRRSRARPATAAAAHAATVTDAHVVLGHLPANLLGGRMALDTAAPPRRDRARGRGRRSGSSMRGRGARHPGDRRQQHGGRDARRLGRARPRSARLHAGAVRRRRAAAWLRAGRAAGHHARADPARARRAVRRRAAGRRPEGRVQPHPAQGRRGRRSRTRARPSPSSSAQADAWFADEKVAPRPTAAPGASR